jgi:hypothetical protein
MGIYSVFLGGIKQMWVGLLGVISPFYEFMKTTGGKISATLLIFFGAFYAINEALGEWKKVGVGSGSFSSAFALIWECIKGIGSALLWLGRVLEAVLVSIYQFLSTFASAAIALVLTIYKIFQALWVTIRTAGQLIAHPTKYKETLNNEGKDLVAIGDDLNRIWDVYEQGSQAASDKVKDAWHNVNNPAADEEKKDYKWQYKGSQATGGFAGLNRVMQEYYSQNNQAMALKSNTDATMANTRSLDKATAAWLNAYQVRKAGQANGIKYNPGQESSGIFAPSSSISAGAGLDVGSGSNDSGHAGISIGNQRYGVE